MDKWELAWDAFIMTGDGKQLAVLINSDEPIPGWLRFALAARIDPGLCPETFRPEDGRIIYARPKRKVQKWRAYTTRIEMGMAVVDACAAGVPQKKSAGQSK